MGPTQGYAPGGVTYAPPGQGPAVVAPPVQPRVQRPAPGTTAAMPPIVMQGGQPTLGAYSHGGNTGQITDPAALAEAHAAAAKYARTRFAQMQKIAAMLPPEMQQQLAAAQRGVDPAAAWRQISGAFAQLSKTQGYQDPRYFLRYVLPEQLRQQQATGANPRQGGV